MSPWQLTPYLTNFVGGTAATIPVPNQLDLIGLTVFHQCVLLDPTAPANPMGLVTTSAVAARLGI